MLQPGEAQIVACYAGWGWWARLLRTGRL